MRNTGIADVIKRLPNEEDYPIYQIFGIICCFYQYGIATYPDILPLCLPKYSKQSIQRVIDSTETDLKGLVTVTKIARFDGLIAVHEEIAKTAVQVRYRCKDRENYPYPSNLLKESLISAISNLDITKETHQAWLRYQVKSLALNQQDDLVSKVLRDFNDKIQSVQNKENSVHAWRTWVNIYKLVHSCDEVDRCLQAIISTEPQDSAEYQYKLSIIIQNSSLEKIRDILTTTNDWLQEHSENTNVRSQYLGLIERHGTPEQIINILTTTNDWLETHPENTNVRSQYLGLIERHGTPEQIINILTTTNDWLETHPEDTRVREKYLDLVQQCGTEKQKEKAIYVITDWLESHTKDNNIRVKYLSLVGRESKLVEDIQLIINTQWKWIEQKNKIEQCLWNAFLPVVHHHVKNNSQFIQQISQLALKQYPNNHTIACSIFYFQDYLEIETCYKLADFIADSDLPKRKWHSKVLVANFFREYEDLDKAEKIYLRTINNSRYCIDEFGYDLEDTYNFACLNYARLLIWKRPSQWKKAMDRYLEPLLKIKKTHSLAHLYLAQCHIEKIKNYKQTRSNVYNPIIHHFRQAIKYQEDSSENSKYEYEFGTFYWKIVENIMQARQHFNLSIGYRDNLPACVSLAELELEASNNNKAQKYIEQGLAIKMITRTEQEEKQKLMTQIINIKQQLEKNIN